MKASVQKLERDWLSKKTAKAGQNLIAAVNEGGGRAALVGGAVFIQVPLPEPLQNALAAYKTATELIVGNWQKVLTDLLLFRVLPPDPYRKPSLPAFIFEELDKNVITASKEHQPVGAELSMWSAYCFSAERTGTPLKRSVFDLDMKRAHDSLKGNAKTPTEIKEFERGLAQCAPALDTGIRAFQEGQFFEEQEVLTVHWQDDDADSHGVIWTPWVLSVGRTHALVEIRRGTWY